MVAEATPPQPSGRSAVQAPWACIVVDEIMNET